MSTRPEGDRPALAPEDDWFAAPGRAGSSRDDEWFAPGSDEPQAAREAVWEDEADPDREPYHGPEGLGQRQLTVVAAALGIVAVIAVAILVVRAFGSDESGSTATTTPLATTQLEGEPATTAPAPATSAVTTTGTTTTPATTTPATTTPATTTGTITSVPAEQSLKPGMSGSSVLALQQALVQLDYDPGTPDGSYGPATTQAVTAFQQDNALTQDGIAGPATLAAVNAALARG